MSELFDSLKSRITGLIAMCTVTKVTDAPEGQLCAGEILAGEAFSEAERIQPHGLATIPTGTLRAIVLCANGERTNAVIATGDDPSTRPQDLEPGDVCLYNDVGSRIVLKADGSIELYPQNGKINVFADMAVTGNITAKNMTAAQSIADQGGAKTMAGMRTTYNNHGHPTGGMPNQQM